MNFKISAFPHFRVFRCRHLAANAPALPATLTAANILAVDGEGWAKLSSYGDYPNQGVKGGVPHLQRVDRAAGERLAANFRPFLKRLLRVHTGLPVFKGHPDAPGFESVFPDKTNYGTIAAVEARDDGIYVRPVLSPEGADLVEKGWKYLSSYWNQEEIGHTPDGRPIASPFELKSVGLVLAPNIPGPAINANLPPPFPPMIKEQLIALLALLGITAPPETADDAFAPFIDQAKAAIKPKIEAEAELPAANVKIATLTASLATASAQATAAQQAAANAAATATAARADAAAVVIAAAVQAGRVRTADQATAKAALIAAANFGAECTRLQALPSLLKVASRFAPAAQDKAQQAASAERTAKTQAAVNARMASHGEDYTTAFTAVKHDPAHAALFAAMKSPEPL